MPKDNELRMEIIWLHLSDAVHTGVKVHRMDSEIGKLVK